MAVEELDNVNPAAVQSAYEKDVVYLGCNGAGAIDARVDIKTIAGDSLTFEQELMDFNSRFVLVLAFADSINRELIGKGNVMGGMLTL
jgi:hypothetical protein